MEQNEERSGDSPSSVHQYPDPDSAAYFTNYPWIVDDDDYVPAALQQSSVVSYEEEDDDEQGREPYEWQESGELDFLEQDITHSRNYLPSINFSR